MKKRAGIPLAIYHSFEVYFTRVLIFNATPFKLFICFVAEEKIREANNVEFLIKVRM